MMRNNWPYITPGIPDDSFIRGDFPMTKQEVRVNTLSELRLTPEQTVYDIGAGTGSIAVEIGLLLNQGAVYAVEKKPAGIDLIRKNKAKFAVDNLIPVPQEAPGAISDLPAPDRVIIGGSGGQLPAILTQVTDKLKPKGRIVVNAITLDTLETARQELNNLGYQVKIKSITVARTKPVGEYQLLQGQNPIYIISGSRNR